MLDKSSPIPLYFQIARKIRQDISDGKFPPREKLPSEYDLAEKFGVSRVTIRSALQLLKRKNYIYTLHGKGTFISPKHVEGMGGFASFTEKCAIMGCAASSELLDHRTVDCIPREMENKLKLKKEEIENIEFTKIHRLRLMDDEPVLIEKAYLPHNILPGIQQIDKKYFETGSLYNLMGSEWGKIPSWSDSVLFARLTTEEEMHLFRDNERVPVIVSWKVILSELYQLIEITESVFGQGYLFEHNAFRG